MHILKLDFECGLGVKGLFSLYLACMSLAQASGCLHSQSKADAFSHVRYPLCVYLCLASVHFGVTSFVSKRVQDCPVLIVISVFQNLEKSQVRLT